MPTALARSIKSPREYLANPIRLKAEQTLGQISQRLGKGLLMRLKMSLINKLINILILFYLHLLVFVAN